MRVITGTARGKRLVTVAGNDIVRPTGEKVKITALVGDSLVVEKIPN